MNNSDICIVIPAKNEQSTVGQIVKDCVKQQFSVIVVDDHSTDLTAQIAEENGAIVLKHIKSLGAWKATQTGIRYAKLKGYKAVVTMDADGQHDANDIATLLVKAEEDKVDIVIGNCTSRGSLGRHLTWKLFRALNGFHVSDITSGFRFYNVKAIECLCSKYATMLEYQCVGVLLMMRNSGLEISEVYISMHQRLSGISHIFYSWSAVLYYLLYSGVLSFSKAFPTNKSKYNSKIMRLNHLE